MVVVSYRQVSMDLSVGSSGQGAGGTEEATAGLNAAAATTQACRGIRGSTKRRQVSPHSPHLLPTPLSF